MFTISHLRSLARRFARSERGTITVEFVIWAPLLIYIGVAMFTLSFYVATSSEVQQVAHEVARSSFLLVNGGQLSGDLCDALTLQVLPRVTEGMALVDLARFSPIATCPAMPDANHFVTVQLTYDIEGTTLDSLGRMIGMDFGTITRFSLVQL